MPTRISRRAMLLGTGVSAGTALGGFALGRGTAPEQAAADEAVEFRGEHQSGIITPAQQQMLMVAFDVVATRREDLVALLRTWTLAAERMQAGEPVNPPKTRDDVPPDDTGEAMGLRPSRLSITFGFGAGLFREEFGLDRYCPQALRQGIPRMAAEKIDEDRSHGDLVIQICAEDPMVVLHAMHQFKRLAFGTASVRWMQLGYGRTASTSTQQETPRNLFGFKDGTANIKAEDSAKELDAHLWIQPDDDVGAWAAGGTYLCVRKIHMMMEVWDELVLAEQQRIIGRDKVQGAPMSGGEEFSAPDFHEGSIDAHSHLATVHPVHNEGVRMLRRGYNYTEGLTELGRLQAGLFFIAYVRDPRTHFIPVLSRMADDLLTEYLQHIATGLYLIPPGIREGEEYVGQRLLG
ncbi:deferrochelatase/peroxidase EfeB [Corynebacterium sp. zg-331]|uniref:iron uptake transporter deferrochelatase/peroxidase subunit n=1 Tax=unclassified Corynebacterium TaxID=2624378 RepID=UPI00128AFBC0|nr:MULTISPECIES: iron uptake transporter deferrochelatase/peroxidase subunit [unclassified Corynebacterium]MBC3185989.1 deferrochelatase/peroxidase EfeB [Corynebacterium sp. zg-331]MPV52480.1 deferrochelatase/peroxidase EfeB [Corynebacterium sp. zg331]